METKYRAQSRLAKNQNRQYHGYMPDDVDGERPSSPAASSSPLPPQGQSVEMETPVDSNPQALLWELPVEEVDLYNMT